ncbi:MAG: ATP-binding cassette domain-containing protein [Planctomycetes bacterium]|jgi:subfamily B ATP-binding cassette protein MsbA|nr:ATP-binding cassette domain-containing protein [Planctomycetota bacterium]
MKDFWYFTRQMLRHRTLIGLSFAAAVIDAACAGGGFTSLMFLIDQLFGSDRTIRELAVEKLADPRLVNWIGDHSDLAQRLPEGRFEGFAVVLVLIFILVLIGSVARFTQQTCIITVSIRTVARIRQLAFARLIHTPLELVLNMGTADNMTRVVRDTGYLVRGFNALMGKAVRDVLLGLTMLLVAFFHDWKLTLLFLIALPIVFALVGKFGRKLRRATKYAMRAYGGMIEAMVESLRGVRVVKTHNAESRERRRFAEINRRVLAQEMRARTVRALGSPVIETITIAAVMAVALVAAYYAFNSATSDPRDMAKVLLLLGAAGAAMRPLANLNNDLQEASAGAVRLREILTYPVERHARHSQTLTALPRHHESVRFEEVRYRYPRAENDALDGVSLEVPFGQTVAIVGPNGSGKSTLLALIPQLLTPTAGRVLIDGTDLATVSLRTLRRQLAVVTQDTVLFAGTIAENIAYGQLKSSADAVESAAKAAHAWEFIRELPQGMETELSEGGEGLSGGQKQRLCIARAILRDPAILILDEATSQIDADSEAKINAAIKAASQGRTTFIIAHRLSTVIDADLIVVMADGRIVDRGRHHDLLDRCTIYQTLTRTQLGGGQASDRAGANAAPADPPRHSDP